MPFIDIKTSVKLNDGQITDLKSACGKAITLIPGKTEEVTMVGILGDYALFLGGNALDKGAFVDVRTYRSSSAESKSRVNASLSAALNQLLDIPMEHIYINFIELSEWGYKGQLLKEG